MNAALSATDAADLVAFENLLHVNLHAALVRILIQIRAIIVACVGIHCLTFYCVQSVYTIGSLRVHCARISTWRRFFISWSMQPSHLFTSCFHTDVVAFWRRHQFRGRRRAAAQARWSDARQKNGIQK
jgi:hypothetical protein